jgi:hypothetical protein
MRSVDASLLARVIGGAGPVPQPKLFDKYGKIPTPGGKLFDGYGKWGWLNKG